MFWKPIIHATSILQNIISLSSEEVKHVALSGATKQFHGSNNYWYNSVLSKNIQYSTKKILVL